MERTKFLCFPCYFSEASKGDEIEDSVKVKPSAQEPMVRTPAIIIIL